MFADGSPVSDVFSSSPDETSSPDEPQAWAGGQAISDWHLSPEPAVILTECAMAKGRVDEQLRSFLHDELAQAHGTASEALLHELADILQAFLDMHLDDVMAGAAKPLMARLAACRGAAEGAAVALCTRLLLMVAPCMRIADYAESKLNTEDLYHTPSRAQLRLSDTFQTDSRQASPSAARPGTAGSLRAMEASFMSCGSPDTSMQQLEAGQLPDLSFDLPLSGIQAPRIEVIGHSPMTATSSPGPRPPSAGSPNNTSAMDLSHLSVSSSLSSANNTQANLSATGTMRYRGLLADTLLGTPRGRPTPALPPAPTSARRLPSVSELDDSSASSSRPETPSSPVAQPPSYHDFAILKPLSSGAYGFEDWKQKKEKKKQKKREREREKKGVQDREIGRARLEKERKKERKKERNYENRGKSEGVFAFY